MKRLVGVWRWALVLVFSAAPTAHAGVTAENTRTIYPAGQKTVSVLLKNEGDRPSLVQVWISDGDLDQSLNVSRAPFVLDKPMLRLEPGSSYAIRVRSIPQMAPQGKREYLYWLNVLEIPSRDESADNEVQIAVRLRMKLFYRPAGLLHRWHRIRRSQCVL